MGCTTILVGKKASYDGSTMIARNEMCIRDRCMNGQPRLAGLIALDLFAKSETRV